MGKTLWTAEDLADLVLTAEDLRFNELIQSPNVQCEEVQWIGDGPPCDGHAHRGSGGSLFRCLLDYRGVGMDVYLQVKDPEWRGEALPGFFRIENTEEWSVEEDQAKPPFQWAVSTESDGVIAYFQRESDAALFVRDAAPKEEK